MVIADIQMPATKDLVDVVYQLKKLGDTPIIVLTQFKNVRETAKQTSRVVKAGAEAVIAKPMKAFELMESDGSLCHEAFPWRTEADICIPAQRSARLAWTKPRRCADVLDPNDFPVRP